MSALVLPGTIQMDDINDAINAANYPDGEKMEAELTGLGKRELLAVDAIRDLMAMS